MHSFAICRRDSKNGALRLHAFEDNGMDSKVCNIAGLESFSELLILEVFIFVFHMSELRF